MSLFYLSAYRRMPDGGREVAGDNDLHWILNTNPNSRMTAVGLASRVQTVETKVTSIEGVNTAQAQQLTGLQTSLDGKASASSVQSIGNRVTDAEGKLTSQSSAITGLTNALPGKANVATVDALTNTVNQQGGAITAQGQSLTNIAASISTVGGQNLIYKVSGSYTVKLGVTANGIQYASGFGLGLDNSAGPTQSRFVVSADSFAILNANPNDGAVFSPFAVTGGQVFINEVFIKNGSIDNAKIGDMLYSSNYQPQRAGWLLKKDGVFEINSTIPGAGRVLINGNGVYIYDENNVLRVQLGNLG
ncbi:hypothetical protein VT47_10430 [Pseudomonas syringae pv. syringae]|nr:DUF1983 domain-containing protein [Pseudomonas syringae]KZL39576.1 hypothetical protein VT47_10430 [Pseudomonas syringae pv. syringae]